MTQRKVKFKPGNYIIKCPKCSNNTDFTIKSDYCAEDCCEIWVECKCGYDPTSEKHAYRLEDVMGGVDDDNCKAAIEVSWNETLLDNLEFYSNNKKAVDAIINLSDQIEYRGPDSHCKACEDEKAGIKNIQAQQHTCKK